MSRDAEVKFRATPDEVEEWRAVAAGEGTTLSEWLRERASSAPTLRDAGRAHSMVASAIRDGRLERSPCETCGAAAEAHHDDYSKPLQVRWLCRKHHREWHKEHPSGVPWDMWNLRINEEDLALWRTTAARVGVPLSEFIRQAGTEKARVIESEEEMATTEVEAELQADEEAAPVDDASETEETEDETEDLGREPWEGVLATIGSPTTDGRYLVPGLIEDRLSVKPYLPFSVQPALAEGHEGALNAGRIEQIEYVPFAEFERKEEFYKEQQIENMPDHAVVIFGSGTVDDSPAGQEAKRQIDNGADVSLDGLHFNGLLYNAETFNEVTENDVAELGEGGIFQKIFEGEFLQGLEGSIGGATVVSIGAFEEARVIITASGSLRMVEPAADSAADRFAVLVAAAGPIKPLRGWFEDPNLKELTPLKITKDGRVFGHLCDWNGCHTGFRGVCVPPFRSPSNYAYFNVGEIETAEGTMMPCGKLMFSMDGGKHAPTDPSLSYLDVQRHYDDATKVGAFVRAGADRFGTWLAGTLRPGLNDLEIQHLRLHPPSGDWRPVHAATDLVAAFAVPIPGYPIARPEALVASAGGDITAIISAPLEIEETAAYTKRRKRLKEAMGEEFEKPRTRAEIRREVAERLANGPWEDGLEDLAEITAEQRRAWAKSGVAMADGSYPVTKCTGDGTSAVNARRAIGRAPASKRAAVKAHISKREKALGCSNSGD